MSILKSGSSCRDRSGLSIFAGFSVLTLLGTTGTYQNNVHILVLVRTRYVFLRPRGTAFAIVLRKWHAKIIRNIPGQPKAVAAGDYAFMLYDVTFFFSLKVPPELIGKILVLVKILIS